MVFSDDDLRQLKARTDDAAFGISSLTQKGLEALLARLAAAETVCQASEELINRARLMCGYKIQPGDPPAIIQLKDMELAMDAWRKASGRRV